jgi:anti-sigma B factor antagonist
MENTNLEHRYADKTVRIGNGLSMQPMPSELGTQAGCSAEVNVIRLAGRLSLETDHDFISTMRSLLVLDMSRVSFLDSAGVGALVALFVSRRHTGKKLALAALAQQNIAALQVSGLIELLPVCASVDLAICQVKM